MQTPFKSTNDLLAGQPRATRPAYSQDERKTELGVVVSVELLNMRKLFWRAVRQSCRALLVGRFGGQTFANHRLTSQFRMGAHQSDLGVAPSAL